MNDEHINYRLQKAKESLQAAQIMRENKQWNFCVNRLYYSCFYAAIGLLLKHDITPKTHEGARNQLGQHFVKTGKIEKEQNDLYAQLFNWRQKGDYGDMFDFKEEDVIPLFDPVHRFITIIEGIVRSEQR
jgi:uncharacterized protein (UPF0332 family)